MPVRVEGSETCLGHKALRSYLVLQRCVPMLDHACTTSTGCRFRGWHSWATTLPVIPYAHHGTATSGHDWRPPLAQLSSSSARCA